MQSEESQAELHEATPRFLRGQLSAGKDRRPGLTCAMEPACQVCAGPGDAMAIPEPAGGLVEKADIADTVRELILTQLK